MVGYATFTPRQAVDPAERQPAGTVADTWQTRRHVLGSGIGMVAAAMPQSVSTAARAAVPKPPDTARTRFRSAQVEGVEVFYREAGRPGAPVVLLLHGFPTSSRMYRNLIPLLAGDHHVIAPDYPAFGHSGVPARDAFLYTHAHLSRVIEAIIDQLGVKRYALYLMDFGGPIGYQIMLRDPSRVTGVIVQNTPVFGEPSDGPIWGPLLAYWKDRSSGNEAKVRESMSPVAVKRQYTAGVRDPSLLDPDSWAFDSALLARPGVEQIMLDLLYDIRSNKVSVNDAVGYFRAHPAKLMIATGVNDPLFPGAAMTPPASFPPVEFHAIDSGHFALEDHCAEIAGYVRSYLGKVN